MIKYDRVRRAITTDPAIPESRSRIAGPRGSVVIRPKIAIDVFPIFVQDDDVDEDEKPISRGVIYERLFAKIVLSRARWSRIAQKAFIACQGEIQAG